MGSPVGDVVEMEGGAVARQVASLKWTHDQQSARRLLLAECSFVVSNVQRWELAHAVWGLGPAAVLRRKAQGSVQGTISWHCTDLKPFHFLSQRANTLPKAAWPSSTG